MIGTRDFVPQLAITGVNWTEHKNSEVLIIYEWIDGRAK